MLLRVQRSSRDAYELPRNGKVGRVREDTHCARSLRRCPRPLVCASCAHETNRAAVLFTVTTSIAVALHNNDCSSSVLSYHPLRIDSEVIVAFGEKASKKESETNFSVIRIFLDRVTLCESTSFFLFLVVN